MDAPEPKSDVDAPALPASAAQIAAEPDALDNVHLEVRIEELERRLHARSIELETELKAKERLRERVRELTSRVDELQVTASALHREAASSTSLARELDDTLKVAAEARAQLGAALEAERNRRFQAEAALSATEGSFSARTSELEGDVKRLTEERAALLARAGVAEEQSARLEAEMSNLRGEVRALTAKIEAQTDAARKRDEELSAARRNLAQLRQKTAGHEAHIESLRGDLEMADSAARDRVDSELKTLRAELASAHAAREEVLASTAEARARYEAMSARVGKTDSELLAARARAEELSRGMSAARDSLEQARLVTHRGEDEQRRLQAVIDGLQKKYEERRVADEAALAKAMAAAEQIRRDGVEAFEKSREVKIRLEMESERIQQEMAAGMRRVAAESEQLKAKADKLKQELRARADREVAEMRLALDAERARLYADIEAERAARGQHAVPAPAEDPDQRGREAEAARRREIAQEVEGYLTPAPKAPPVEAVVSDLAPVPQAEVPEDAPPPSTFQWDEEMRLLLYVAIGTCVAAAIAAGIAFYQG